ncbi:UbiA family prenyltransferase [Streptomyces pinistramenti]|uniref:UbiA family prenyltransferase n=1 Tax=Streptomyces pinistramenti TaxID=2884812 RepID=UPI001D07236B|nr:UbiA family prenyltransferase [Streptomyces pinistramenti]MCB5909263.1 UbiA family prenyltransferase [Streptomyces pinistramenti]
MPSTGASAADTRGTDVPDATPPRSPRAVLTGLFRACHPEPALAVTALITVLAAASGRSPLGCLLVAAAVCTGQLSVGWCNDRVDIGRDTDAGRSDKPLVAGAAGPRTVAFAAVCALALCVPLSWASGPAAGAAHLAGVAAAWSYNLGVKKTVASWLPYALAFGLLPAFVTLGLPGRPWPPAWSVAAGALLGVGAHVTNVLPDIDADLAAGVRGLPQRLGLRRARLLAPVPLLGASAVLVFAPPGPAGAAGWAAFAGTAVAAVGTVLPARAGSRSRLPFLATLAMAGTAVALLLLRGTALA